MSNSILIWLIIGGGLCSLEFFFPTAFTAFMMGIGALGVAAIATIFPISPNLQIALWVAFSTISVIASRRFFTPRTATRTLSDDPEGKTLTAIAPGEAGRVLYEGNSWRAKCADETLDIGPNEIVYIVQREGTTLIVMPRHLLQS
jgi:membrane protein implicated in regulation of membrane protease activity